MDIAEEIVVDRVAGARRLVAECGDGVSCERFYIVEIVRRPGTVDTGR